MEQDRKDKAIKILSEVAKENPGNTDYIICNHEKIKHVITNYPSGPIIVASQTIIDAMFAFADTELTALRAEVERLKGALNYTKKITEQWFEVTDNRLLSDRHYYLVYIPEYNNIDKALYVDGEFHTVGQGGEISHWRFLPPPPTETTPQERVKGVINWVAFDFNDISTQPKEYDKYLICRKDGKIHWETWNGSGWAYNHNEIRFWAIITPPAPDQP